MYQIEHAVEGKCVFLDGPSSLFKRWISLAPSQNELITFPKGSFFSFYQFTKQLGKNQESSPKHWIYFPIWFERLLGKATKRHFLFTTQVRRWWWKLTDLQLLWRYHHQQSFPISAEEVLQYQKKRLQWSQNHGRGSESFNFSSVKALDIYVGKRSLHSMKGELNSSVSSRNIVVFMSSKTFSPIILDCSSTSQGTYPFFMWYLYIYLMIRVS